MQTLDYKGKVREIPSGTKIEVTGRYMKVLASDFKTFDRAAYAYYTILLNPALLSNLDVEFVKEYKDAWGLETKVYIAK